MLINLLSTTPRYIIPRFQPASDAIVSLAWLLEMLSLQKADLSELTQRVPRFSVGHQAVPCPWDRKGEIMRLLTEAVQSEPAEFIDATQERGREFLDSIQLLQNERVIGCQDLIHVGAAVFAMRFFNSSWR